MFCAIDVVKEFISNFNWEYQKNDIVFNDTVFNNLILYLRRVYEIGMLDSVYLKKAQIDFQVLYEQIQNIERAAADKDLVHLYDKLNCEIRVAIDNIGKILFEEAGEILKEWFWRENYEAVKQRYPKLAEQIEEIDIKEQKYIREYGLRGKVIYRKSCSGEYDLYSFHSPSEVGIQTAYRSDLSKYDKIYVLGFDGGYEFSGKHYISGGKAKIEIYIDDLIELKQILCNTLRKGLLLNPNINLKYNMEIKDFLNGIDLREKDKSYIYLTKGFENGLKQIEEFVKNNFYNTNIWENI